MINKGLEKLSKKQLIELLEIYSKNWLATDGLWFQSVEKKFGIDEAMLHDKAVWNSFTVIEAKRIKKFLNLPEHAGLDGLAKALQFRFYGNLNENSVELTKDKLIFRNISCRVQTARKRKNMPYHPCKSVGIIEYSGFAKVIDDRILCNCISCFPDVTENPQGCAWEFYYKDK